MWESRSETNSEPSTETIGSFSAWGELALVGRTLLAGDANSREQHSNSPEQPSNTVAGAKAVTREATTAGGDKHKPATFSEADLSRLLTKYDLHRRVDSGRQEFFYRANATDNVVFTTRLDTSRGRIASGLDRIVRDRISAAEKKYGVDFAEPGEEVDKQRVITNGKNCSEGPGAMMHSIQPTFPVIHAVEQALKRSTPSQHTYNGTGGTKIYFLDGQPSPNIYGNKPILGLYVTDKDSRQALYLTPAGLALPPTAIDEKTTSGRNLQGVVSHELSHNSQQHFWTWETSSKLTKDMGWQDSSILKGKNGQYFMHGYDTCNKPSFWYATNQDGKPLNARGNVVKSENEALKFTNEQVMDRAQVRPVSYYFGSPFEMFAEGLTAFRSGREARAKLLKDSPQFYNAAKEYDQKELGEFYGLNSKGQPKFLRTPEGFPVRRERATENSVWLFEQANTK